MGKLTGPSKLPASETTNPQVEDEGEGETTATVQCSEPSSPEPNSKNSEGNSSEASPKPNSNIPLANRRRRRSQQRESELTINGKSQGSHFSSSMIAAVNNAAETARLVLDQAASTTTGEDSKVSTSRGSHRRSASDRSVHSYISFDSQRSFKEENEMVLATGSEDEEAPDANNSDTDIMQGEEASTGDNFIGSGTPSEAEAGAPFSPPPNAFANLPMTHGFVPTHKSHDNDDNDLLAKGGVFEVTTHFNAASAISAALANSHLAQASGGVGELQKPAKFPRPYSRRSSSGEINSSLTRADVDAARLGFRRASSGDASAMFIRAMKEIKKGQSDSGEDSQLRRRSGGLPTPEEAEAEMMSHRDSWVSVDDDSSLGLGSHVSDAVEAAGLIIDDKNLNHSAPSQGGTSSKKADSQDQPHGASYVDATVKMNSGKEDSHPTPMPSRLPSAEEAQVQMLSNRNSFVSMDDVSFGSQQEQLVEALKSYHVAKKKVQPADGNQTDNNALDKKDQITANVESHLNDEQGNTVPMKLDDCASISNSSFENESNTSSYGKSGDISDISPISSITGDSLHKQGNNKNGGILGNLSSSRRTCIGDTNHSLQNADDEYSTQSENSGHDAHKQQLQGQKAQDGNTASAITGPPVKDLPQRKFVIKPQGLAMSGSQTDDSNSSSTPNGEVSKQSSFMKKTLLSEHPLQPAHRDMFESFDRNWEQTVQGSSDPERMLDLGRKCFAAFAIVFGACKDVDICPKLEGNTNIDDEERITMFRWWVDEYGLTADKNSREGAANEQNSNLQSIPIAVVQCLWKACFFGEEDDADAESFIDQLQQILVKELCYLNETETPSASCLCLSLDVYAEYGLYILRRFAMQDQVSSWHSTFSAVLRKALLDGSLTDGDSMIKRRYAAHALPRHVAVSVLGVDSEGKVQIEAREEIQTELRTKLFEDLLFDHGFIKSRANLLGRGNTRPHDVDQSLNVEGAGPQIAKQIKTIRDKDRNMLISTMNQCLDIEWVATLCIPDYINESEGSEPASLLSDCLSAIEKWKEQLIATYRSLKIHGKLSILDDTPKKSVVESRSEDNKSASVNFAQLVSYYKGSRENDCVETAKELLSIDDAWTMKDDSAKLFKGGMLTSATEISPRLPPRKGRRRRTSEQGDQSVCTPLARILNIDINDLRAAISIGRSLIGLSEFAHRLAEKEIFAKQLKGSTLMNSLNGLQSSCLANAIEVLSCTAVTLGYILSSTLDQLDDEDLDETVNTDSMGPDALLRRFALTRDASKPLLSVAGILSSDAWFTFGKLVSKSGKSNANSHMMLFSFERALTILNSPKSTSLNKPALDILCESLLSPLTQYKCFLQSNINHSVGVYSYEQGDFERAAEFLTKSSRFRRQLLDDLRSRGGENADNADGLTKLFNAVFGGMQSIVSPAAISEEVFKNVWKYAISFSCGQLPRGSFSVGELELSLSLTLEYAALTQHAGQNYQQALAKFQESLIFRTMHVGKHSLDVASLHFNMGVVYDDLDQSDQAVSRYHESLRIRLDQMKNATTPAAVSELEDSVLLTLKCMGHVYKIINDFDNSICCYVKAIELVTKKYVSYLEHADEWAKMGLRLGLSVPVPTIIFDEMKASAGNASCKPHFQMMNKKELCHVFEPKIGKRRSRSTISKLKKEFTKLHTTVIELTNEKKQNAWDSESGSSKMKLPGSSLLLASLSSTFKTGGDAFESALMRSSFALGRIRLDQMRYEEAADHLETCLRSKWVLDPSSSSDSDSDFSRKSRSSRNKQVKTFEEDNPEEGQIYYALGICNAALDDHERAVRCFLTSMRYLRRSSKKVDSLEVARVLFDCATSHYYLCNFDQAVSLYSECLRILKSFEENEDDSRSTNDSMEILSSFRLGIVLYCLVVAKAAIDFDSDASNLLNEAQILLSGCSDKIILAYMEFLTGLFLHHAASQVPNRLRSITRITPTGLSLDDGLSWHEMCQSALNLLEQVKNECYFDPLEGVEDSEEIKHLPLSGHICFKKGQVYELIESTDQALNSYVDAANFYRIACGDDNMYVASVLNRMGMICSERTEYHALGYFNEALQIRKNLLGGNDHLVADTLYASAVVLARLGRYEASMERYHEALRIQMADSQDSNEVARTLGGMGGCHYNHRAFDLALTCLEGAVKIRKYRVSQLTTSDELVELYAEEVSLGAEFFNLGNVHMQMGDYAQAMQCLIQSRDLRWRHVGSGTVEMILEKYYSESTIDEDELLGLAHCLHNIGVVFDIKKEYNRSLPHYEEALAIKNAIAGFSANDSMSLVDQVNTNNNDALVLHSLNKDIEFPRTNKATLSASVTRQKIATVYARQKKYDRALFHFSHALRIQRHVLGKDNFRIGPILSSMGNALRKTSDHSETAILCYNESLRISKLRYGEHHQTVASALFDIGSLYETNQNVGKAMHCYRRAISVYKQKYSQELRARLCSGLDRPISLEDGAPGNTEILSTGDEVAVIGTASGPEKQIREQYALVTKALRNAKSQDMINRGESIGWIGDSDDAWLTFEVLLFRFVEMLSTYIVDPAQNLVRTSIDGSRRRIESAAAQAVISAKDAVDYQFLLMLQE